MKQSEVKAETDSLQCKITSTLRKKRRSDVRLCHLEKHVRKRLVRMVYFV
eukprot:TRINITY_DN1251_c0_g2_i1.p1 TRINITY_DN1251_c0_g2~~TRINITY_DN1251_c0_g2_i1.p1  ORF type:complete len:50 (+),score=1.79 TRINITY_DN1251_c0_g2_i1:154-303(+)